MAKKEVKTDFWVYELLKEAGIEKVKFDKNGYQYHGVVKAFADALRDNGIKL